MIIEAILWPLLVSLLSSLLIGLIGGLLAGLAGVGGGLIYTPFYFILLSKLADYDSPKVMGMAVSASLIAVVITALFSTKAHFRLGHVHLPSIRYLLPGLLLFSTIGLWSSFYIAEGIVLTLLAMLNLYIACSLHRVHSTAASKKIPLFPILLSAPIGYISGLLGIGGGTMLVPLLRYSQPLAIAVGTSSACGLLMAGGSCVLNFVLHDTWREALIVERPLFIASWLGIALSVSYGSTWAARMHQTYPEHTIQRWLQTLFFLLTLLLTSLALLRF